MKHLHQREIKSVIDEIKNYYLLHSKIKIEDLRSAIDYFKKNWRELKEQAREMRRLNEVVSFASYQF